MTAPHDEYFKATFSDPQVAAALLQHILPERWVRAIDWSSLQLLSSELPEAQLSSRQADLMFSVQLKNGTRCVLLILVEHQSRTFRRMPLRMLFYGAAGLERWARAHPEAPNVPLVLPIVVYHGHERWLSPRRLDLLSGVPPELLEDAEIGFDVRMLVHEINPEALRRSPVHPVVARSPRGSSVAPPAQTSTAKPGAAVRLSVGRGDEADGRRGRERGRLEP